MNTQMSLLQPRCHLKYTNSKSAVTLRHATRARVATNQPAVLQSLYLHAAEESSVEGLGIMPQEWGVPAGHLYSEGKYVCHIPALEHLGISLETGPFELGRDHYSSALLTAMLNKLERRHVGSWLLDAARSPEAAYLFQSHSVLREWLRQLAEQRHGKSQCLLVELGNPSAVEAAEWLQSLSSCFGKELHNIPVAFKYDTAAAAHELLFTWLLELPLESSDATASQTLESIQIGLTQHQLRTRNFLVHIAELLPHKPTLLIKQLPVAGSAAFNSRISSSVPAAAALAGLAARSRDSQAAMGIAVAAGWVDDAACICVAGPVLEKAATSAAMHMIMAAQQGLKLSSSQCAAAINAAAAAAAPVVAVAIEHDMAVVAGSDEGVLSAELHEAPGDAAAAASTDIAQPLDVHSEINATDVSSNAALVAV